MIAFLGLGAMGRPMAANLAAARPTVVWNRTTSVARAFAEEHGARLATTLSDVAGAEVVASCLPTTTEVAAVAEELVPHLAPGTVWVDHTSGDPAASRALAATLAERRIDYLDAPVSGGVGGAVAGTLTVMVGGEAAVLERVRDVLAIVGARIVHLGPTGAGHATKAVNNALMAAHLWAASEGFVALAAAGVDVRDALEVINASSGRSLISEWLFPEHVVTRRFAADFSLPLLAKDVRLAGDVLRAGGVEGPVLSLVEQLTTTAAADLGAGADHSEIVTAVERDAGRELS